MLGKLMKYEFKATSRIFLPLFAALILVTIVSNLLLGANTATPSVIAYTVSFALMVGIAVATFVITIQRFSKNLIGDEGYLMFTLPTSTEGLVFSKLFVSTIWQIASAIVVLLGIYIMTLGVFQEVDFKAIIEAIKQFFSGIDAHSVLFLVEAFVALIVSTFAGTLMIYCCIALSMLFNKRRGLVSFVAFIGFTIIGEAIIGTAARLGLGQLIIDFVNGITSMNARLHVAMLGIILVCAVICAVFYLITRTMLKNKLNLE